VVTVAGSPPLDQVVASLLTVLKGYLPPPIPQLPAPLVTLASLTERSAGLGSYRGDEALANIGLAELKAVRLEALVRFQLWGADPGETETAAADLAGRLLKDRDSLRSRGVLRLSLEDTPFAEFERAPNAWHKGSGYRILYEFPYRDGGGAQSLIARIPVQTDLDQRDSPDEESTIVTDEMVRWDDLAAPPIRIRGPSTAGALASLVFQPGPEPAGTVTVLRTFDGAVGAPVDHPSLSAFLDAVTGPSAPERHARTTFASLGAFLASLGPPGTAIDLGDWDLNGNPDAYEPRTLAIDPPIELERVTDLLEVSFQQSAFDQVTVAYLRIRRGESL